MYVRIAFCLFLRREILRSLAQNPQSDNAANLYYRKASPKSQLQTETFGRITCNFNILYTFFRHISAVLHGFYMRKLSYNDAGWPGVVVANSTFPALRSVSRAPFVPRISERQAQRPWQKAAGILILSSSSAHCSSIICGRYQLSNSFWMMSNRSSSERAFLLCRLTDMAWKMP